MLSCIRTVLIHNSHPGNIGAVARALKNMGLNQLFLVAPKNFPSMEARARAKNAEDILNNAVVVSTLPEALVGCQWVLGSSARFRSLAWPIWTAKEAAARIIEELMAYKTIKIKDINDTSNINENNSTIETNNTNKNNIAILYGCEQHGLSNEELHYCQKQIMIPTNSEYAALNVAQAVQIISYELFLAFQEINQKYTDTVDTTIVSTTSQQGQDSVPLATFEEMDGFFKHLENTLINIEYLDVKKPRQLMPRLKRLFDRARLDKIELNILRGVFTTIDKIIEKTIEKKIENYE